METIIALREGKDVSKVDSHSLQEAIESINMMAHLLVMAALPAINVSIFTPSQQECLMYAHRKVNRIKNDSLMLTGCLDFSGPAVLRDQVPLIVQYIYFLEPSHYQEHEILKLAVDPEVWKKFE